MPNYYLMITTDADTASAKRVPAAKLIEWRLQKRLWPLYSRTPYRREIQPGDELLFYQGGHFPGSQSIVGQAKVSELLEGRLLNEIDPHYSLSSPCKLALRLTEIITFAHPVEMRPLIGELSIFPKRTKHWGNLIMAGCKRISESDYQRVIATANLPGALADQEKHEASPTSRHDPLRTPR